MTTSTKPTEMRGRGNKGGRPTLPQARRRSKSITVKFSKIDYETLRIRSQKANRRLAEYIRETALQTELPTAHTTVDAAVFRNLAGMANRSNSVRLLPTGRKNGSPHCHLVYNRINNEGKPSQTRMILDGTSR